MLTAYTRATPRLPAWYSTQHGRELLHASSTPLLTTVPHNWWSSNTEQREQNLPRFYTRNGYIRIYLCNPPEPGRLSRMYVCSAVTYHVIISKAFLLGKAQRERAIEYSSSIYAWFVHPSFSFHELQLDSSIRWHQRRKLYKSSVEKNG